jgi:hypothetical protein
LSSHLYYETLEDYAPSASSKNELNVLDLSKKNTLVNFARQIKLSSDFCIKKLMRSSPTEHLPIPRV